MALYSVVIWHPKPTQLGNQTLLQAPTTNLLSQQNSKLSWSGYYNFDTLQRQDVKRTERLKSQTP
jgi:hypothetical protein